MIKLIIILTIVLIIVIFYRNNNEHFVKKIKVSRKGKSKKTSSNKNGKNRTSTVVQQQVKNKLRLDAQKRALKRQGELDKNVTDTSNSTELTGDIVYIDYTE